MYVEELKSLRMYALSLICSFMKIGPETGLDCIKLVLMFIFILVSWIVLLKKKNRTTFYKRIYYFVKSSAIVIVNARSTPPLPNHNTHRVTVLLSWILRINLR